MRENQREKQISMQRNKNRNVFKSANDCTFVQTYLKANKLDASLPSLVVSLLQEFDDVFPKKVPHGLTPIQGIENQIDFMLDASIPNRLAYQSNPEETKELQRQVSELMKKGYVRESMSLCVVPVILVPKKDGTWRIYVD